MNKHNTHRQNLIIIYAPHKFDLYRSLLGKSESCNPSPYLRTAVQISDAIPLQSLYFMGVSEYKRQMILIFSTQYQSMQSLVYVTNISVSIAINTRNWK